ncbi:MAG TPA: hypothetical protein VFZ53_32265 [Polyangiaceae bacterium]
MKRKLEVGGTANAHPGFGGTLVVLACAMALGCGSGAESATGESSPATTGGPNGLDAASAESASRSPAEILHRLFERMDAVGPGSEGAFQAELRDFLATERPMATLKTSYAAMPKQATGNRWRAVYVAGRIKNADSLAFLEEIALGAPEIDPAAVGEHAGDRGFRLRYTAAVGIVDSFKARVEGADARVHTILKSADPQVAQLAGVELFSSGELTAKHRTTLEARGISANFRRFTEAEHRELMSVKPELTGHRQASTRKRPLSNSVPALEEVQ